MKREELIQFLKWVDASTYWKEDNDVPNTVIVDAYLNSHPSPTVEKPITAEEFVIQKYGENWLNIMWSPEDVLDALEEYASLKPTVAEREVGDE